MKAIITETRSGSPSHSKLKARLMVSLASAALAIGTASAAAQPKELTAIGVSTNGMFLFRLDGPAGSNFLIQVSSDLVNWSDVVTNLIPVSGARVFDFPVPTTQPASFYRALLWSQGPLVLQPGPIDGNDIWTTSVYSYAACSSPGPGGGRNDYQLRVGGWGDEYDSLIQFDLRGLPTNATSAVLYLYCFDGGGGASASPIYLDRITQAWDWQTSGTGCDRERLWWADKPAASLWRTAQLPPPAVGQAYGIDLTDLYNAWQGGTYPNYGLQLRPAANWNNFDEFYSADYTGDPTLRPRLVITP